MNLGQTDTSEFESRIFQRGQGAENVGPNRETVNLGQAAESHFLRVRIPEFYRFQREKAAKELSLSRLFCRRVVLAPLVHSQITHFRQTDVGRQPRTHRERGLPAGVTKVRIPDFRCQMTRVRIPFSRGKSSNPILAGRSPRKRTSPPPAHAGRRPVPGWRGVSRSGRRPVPRWRGASRSGRRRGPRTP